MTTKVTFDTATLADAVGKASRVAPTKGPAFDRAAGIVFEVDFDTQIVTIKSTDLDVSYSQRIGYVGAEGKSVTWRVPSMLASDSINSLPLGSGAQVELIDNDDFWLYVKAGKFVGKFRMLDSESFPMLDDFNTENMLPANEFAKKAEQVAWAADSNKSTSLGGVHIDGKNLVGCDKYCLAIVPCEIPISEPVTVPLWNLAPLLKTASDVRIKAGDTKLLVALDAETKATSSLIEGAFPNYHGLRRTDFAGKLKVNKTEFKEALNRLMTLVKTHRQPRLNVGFDGTGMIKEVILDMDIPQVGRMRDSVSGDMDFDGRFDYVFNPGKLTQGLEACKGDIVTLGFGSNDEYSHKKPLCLMDATGFECYIMAIAEDGAK